MWRRWTQSKKKKRADINRLVCCDLELSLQSLPAIRIIIFLLFWRRLECAALFHFRNYSFKFEFPMQQPSVAGIASFGLKNSIKCDITTNENVNNARRRQLGRLRALFQWLLLHIVVRLETMRSVMLYSFGAFASICSEHLFSLNF